MPKTKSARKTLRQSLKRKSKNVQGKRKLRSLLKETKALALLKKTAEAKKLLPQIYKTLDKSAKRGLIKKNTASRKKSRITRLINKN